MTETQTTETKPAPKPVKVPHQCLCASYEVYDPQDADSVFTTDCQQTTCGTFGQGHDARLVSFLVDAHFDGLKIRMVQADGQTVQFDNPGAAAAVASEALAAKATRATENRRIKLEAKRASEQEREAKKAVRREAADKAKAEKEAAKAKKAANTKAPKQVAAEKVAGSAEGDTTPLGEGESRIKVGKFEYNAMIDDEGNATYTDGSGTEQTVERDGYRLLAS